MDTFAITVITEVLIMLFHHIVWLLVIMIECIIIVYISLTCRLILNVINIIRNTLMLIQTHIHTGYVYCKPGWAQRFARERGVRLNAEVASVE